MEPVEDPKLGPPSLTAAQELMITRMMVVVKRFQEREGKLARFKGCRASLGCARFDYAGEPVQYMEQLEASKVIPCWPKPGEAGIRDAREFVPPEVCEWLDDPRRCLLLQAAWLESPPLSRVRADDAEWEGIVRAGVEQGMMCRVEPSQVFRGHNGKPVLNGGGGPSRK